MRADVLLLRAGYNCTLAHSRRTSDEGHDAGALSRHGGLQQSDGDVERGARAALHSLVGLARPGVLLQVLQHLLQRKGALAHGHEEAAHGRLSASTAHAHRSSTATANGAAGSSLLLALGAPSSGRGDAQHVLHLLRRVLLLTTEHIRLGTVTKAQFVYVYEGAKGNQTHKRILRQ